MATVRFVDNEGVPHDSGLCERNLNLLAHAQAIELEVGSQCGGHGICGKDRILITPEQAALVSPVTEIERAHLGANLLNQGWRLSCQCFPEKSGQFIQVILIPTRI